MYFKDSNSKFGTFVCQTNQQAAKEIPLKAKSDELIEVNSKQIIKFGATTSRVKFIRKSLNFCITRLDRNKKMKVKSAIEIIGGKILNQPDNASHIITDAISGATKKILTAIVFRKNVITTKWFNFAFTERPSEEILPVEK